MAEENEPYRATIRRAAWERRGAVTFDGSAIGFFFLEDGRTKPRYFAHDDWTIHPAAPEPHNSGSAS